MAGVEPNKRPVNMVFQHLALFPMMNVADNIAFGLRRRGEGGVNQKVKAILEMSAFQTSGIRRSTSFQVDRNKGGPGPMLILTRGPPSR